MSDFRKLAHLLEQLGDERFQTLISSDNTGKVKEFCDGLLNNTILTELTNIGPENRNYEILGFLRDDEEHVVGHKMVERAVEMDANLGEDDGQYLLNNQQEIPVSLRGKVVFVFTDWRHPGRSGGVCDVSWDDGRWVRHWGWLDGRWSVRARVLCRK